MLSLAPDLPPLAAAVVGVLALAGSVVALIGAVGFMRLKTFYDRVHPPTLSTSLGLVLVAAASIVTFNVLGTRAVVHEVLLLVFVTLTVPVSMMLIARAAIFRDRSDEYDKTLAADVLQAAQREAAALAAAQREAAEQTGEAAEQAEAAERAEDGPDRSEPAAER